MRYFSRLAPKAAGHESFYVLDGAVEFGFDDETATATAGTLVHLPAGCVHWFRFAAGGGGMISMTGGGNASELFTDLDANVSSTDPDLEKMLEIGARHGLNVRG